MSLLSFLLSFPPDTLLLEVRRSTDFPRRRKLKDVLRGGGCCVFGSMRGIGGAFASSGGGDLPGVRGRVAGEEVTIVKTSEEGCLLCGKSRLERR